MFDAVWDMKIGYVLCGVIWSLACGFAVGNYACSLVHRLPRGRLILDKTPYCGNCGTLLQTKDLFPVFSALLLRHKCRYCHVPFPVSHTWTEILVGLLFVLLFMQYNYGQEFIVMAFLGVFWITLAAIQTNENLVMGRILIAIAVCGMINRTLVDGSIFGFFEGGFYALLLGALLWRKQLEKVGHVYKIPANAQALAVAGICVGAGLLPQLFALTAYLSLILYIVARLRHKTFIFTVPLGFAVMWLVMYPYMFLL